MSLAVKSRFGVQKLSDWEVSSYLTSVLWIKLHKNGDFYQMSYNFVFIV